MNWNFKAKLVYNNHMDFLKPDNSEETIEKLLETLEVNKPSAEEMRAEIAQSGLVIKLEDANVSYFEKHQAEAISSMWKVVRVSKILKSQNLNIDFGMSSARPRIHKKRLH